MLTPALYGSSFYTFTSSNFNFGNESSANGVTSHLSVTLTLDELLPANTAYTDFSSHIMDIDEKFIDVTNPSYGFEVTKALADANSGGYLAEFAVTGGVIGTYNVVAYAFPSGVCLALGACADTGNQCQQTGGTYTHAFKQQDPYSNETYRINGVDNPTGWIAPGGSAPEPGTLATMFGGAVLMAAVKLRRRFV